MRNRIYAVLGVVLLLAAAGILCGTLLGPYALVTSVQGALTEAQVAQLARVKDIYHFAFAPPHKQASSAATYIPRYQTAARAEADTYASLFGIAGEPAETDEAFVYTGESGELTVQKYSGGVSYRAAPYCSDWFSREAAVAGIGENNFADSREAGPPAEPNAAIGKDGAVSAAEAFLRRHGLNAPYNHAVAYSNGSVYTVLFISKLGGIDNYAFPAAVLVDSRGAVLAAEMFAFAYDRLASCRVKPVMEACAALPVDMAGGTRVTLGKCTFTYVFANSILQPAYLLEGETADGAAFRCFVNAAAYP